MHTCSGRVWTPYGGMLGGVEISDHEGQWKADMRPPSGRSSLHHTPVQFRHASISWSVTMRAAMFAFVARGQARSRMGTVGEMDSEEVVYGKASECGRPPWAGMDLLLPIPRVGASCSLSRLIW